ncbi:glutaredoxin [Halofilum ochraceum]|uniref:glutaredoxin n=1 Tax=Halofilum ochraceum TaxID=1611323 RepID=UPI0008DAA0C9|nr:glutaredoxin [Halofilum ochraceum]
MKYVSVDDADAPADIAEFLRSARVVIFRSNLTDTRSLIAHLEREGIGYREITMGMGSGVERDRFHRLRDWTDWPLLPQVFVDGAFVGGAEEALESITDAR